MPLSPSRQQYWRGSSRGLGREGWEGSPRGLGVGSWSFIKPVLDAQRLPLPTEAPSRGACGAAVCPCSSPLFTRVHTHLYPLSLEGGLPQSLEERMLHCTALGGDVHIIVRVHGVTMSRAARSLALPV